MHQNEAFDTVLFRLVSSRFSSRFNPLFGRYRQMMLPTSMYFRWATDPAWPECETSVCAEDTGQPPHLLCVGRQAQLQLCI
ncbi:hypothetical protein SARC_15712, partial [Sphaeroforma arctica JP610]